MIFFHENISINGKGYSDLQYYVDRLPDLVDSYKLLQKDNFSIVHGDLCFSNILFDIKTNILRLIDPRGEFGEFDIYGDVRYDIAKLSHSVSGRYDFIINDLFQLNRLGCELNYLIEDTHSSRIAAEVFEEFIKDYNAEQIKLIEGILFFEHDTTS